MPRPGRRTSQVLSTLVTLLLLAGLWWLQSQGDDEDGGTAREDSSAVATPTDGARSPTSSVDEHGLPYVDLADLLQDVFVRVHRYAGRLDREAHLSGWLYSVARSALVDFQRRRRRPASTSDVEPEDEEQALAEHAGIAGGLRELVASLPERYARAVTLVDLDGLGFREAAAALGLSNPQRRMKKIRSTSTSPVALISPV